MSENNLSHRPRKAAFQKQFANTFPNQNDKPIDYVIVFEKLDRADEKSRFIIDIRDAFFSELKKESFELYYVDYKNGSTTQTYALLHCSADRLYKEAENIKLAMRLKEVIL